MYTHIIFFRRHARWWPHFCRYYLWDAIMLIKLNMVWPWVTGITTLEVAIVVVNFANEHSQRVQDAWTYQAGCANVVIDARTHAYCSLGLFLLTWINCNPSIASSLRIHCKVWHSRRSLAMATYFHPTLYNEWNSCWDNSYSMLVKELHVFKLMHFFYSPCYGQYRQPLCM